MTWAVISIYVTCQWEGRNARLVTVHGMRRQTTPQFAMVMFNAMLVAVVVVCALVRMEAMVLVYVLEAIFALIVHCMNLMYETVRAVGNTSREVLFAATKEIVRPTLLVQLRMAAPSAIATGVTHVAVVSTTSRSLNSAWSDARVILPFSAQRMVNSKCGV